MLLPLDIASIILSGIAALSCVVVCLSFLVFPELRSFINRLILSMSINDLGLCLTLLTTASLANSSNNNLSTAAAATTTTSDFDVPLRYNCEMEAFFLQIFLLGSSLWNFSLGHHLFANVIKRWSGEETVRMYPIYLVLCVCFPCVLALIFHFTGAFGMVGASSQGFWCWIAYEKRYLRIVGYYGPTFFVCLFNLIVIIMVNTRYDITMGKHQRILLYMISHMVTFIPALILRLTDDYSFSLSPNASKRIDGLEVAVAVLTLFRCGILNSFIFSSVRISDPPTLEDILRMPGGADKLLEFLSKEHSQENLLFVQDVRHFKKLSKMMIETKKNVEQQKALMQQCEESAERIWNKYLKNGAAQQVNVTWQSLEKVKNSISEPTDIIFDEVLDEILKVLSDHSFPRFKKSYSYQGLQQEHQQSCCTDNDGRWLPLALIVRLYSMMVTFKDRHSNTEEQPWFVKDIRKSSTSTRSTATEFLVEMQRTPASASSSPFSSPRVGVKVAKKKLLRSLSKEGNDGVTVNSDSNSKKREDHHGINLEEVGIVRESSVNMLAGVASLLPMDDKRNDDEIEMNNNDNDEIEIELNNDNDVKQNNRLESEIMIQQIN